MMSSFCRNLGKVSNEMTYALRNLRAISARVRAALPPTTPTRLRTRIGSGRLQVVPPSPVKTRRQGRTLGVGPY